MNKRILAAAAVYGTVLFLSACGGSVGCTADRKPGLELAFYDHDTGLPLCGVSYKVVSEKHIEEGATPLEGDNCNSVELLEERSGSYFAEIKKGGYMTTTLSVDIFANQCHVITEKIEVDLMHI